MGVLLQDLSAAHLDVNVDEKSNLNEDLDVNILMSGVPIALFNIETNKLYYVSDAFYNAVEINRQNIKDFECVESILFKYISRQLIIDGISYIRSNKVPSLFLINTSFKSIYCNSSQWDVYLLPGLIQTKHNLFAIQLMPHGHKFLDGDDLIAFLAHEIMNPVNNISCAVQLIESLHNMELTDKTKKYLTQIKQNTMVQTRMLNNLLSVSKSHVCQLNDNYDSHNIIRLTEDFINSIRCFAEIKEIVIEFNSNFNEFFINIDANKYEHILLNLISNAIKYSHSGKFIYISTICCSDMFCLKIRDEGEGIDESEKDNIFQRNWKKSSKSSQSTKGFGIGLSIVKHLIISMNGTIEVNSEIGEGTEFTVNFPIEV